MKLTKKLISKEVSNELSLSQKDSKIFVDIIFEILKKNADLSLLTKFKGFGSFYMKKSPKRMGRNPKTAEIVKIPAKKAIKWKMSKALFDRLNKNFTENKLSDTN